MTYTESLAELEKILREMQSDQCNIDTLVEKTKRATALLKACRDILTKTEKELNETLTQTEEK